MRNPFAPPFNLPLDYPDYAESDHFSSLDLANAINDLSIRVEALLSRVGELEWQKVVRDNYEMEMRDRG